MSSTGQARNLRDYAAIAAELDPALPREKALQVFCDAAWRHLAGARVSWIGFYVHEGKDELILAARRDKPACSPIGLHGACGRSFRERRPLVVRDVATLGPNYIACDPRDRSELIIPLTNQHGECWGVLDIDSHDAGAFDVSDIMAFTDLLRRARISAAQFAAGDAIIV